MTPDTSGWHGCRHEQLFQTKDPKQMVFKWLRQVLFMLVLCVDNLLIKSFKFHSLLEICMLHYPLMKGTFQQRPTLFC